MQTIRERGTFINTVKQTLRGQTAFACILLVVYFIWIGLLLAGHLVLFEYELTPSPLTNSKRVFPYQSAVHLARGRNNIIAFIHPACPCSRATIEEFHDLMKEGDKDSVGTVVFFMPPEMESEWSLLPIIQSVKRIRNVTVDYDIDGSEAALFGVTTSGHILIYDSRGVLQFSGGITGSRGHTGDNHFFQLARQAVVNKKAKYAATPVFGCALRSIE